MKYGNDTRKRGFIPESKIAEERLNNLKKRVWETEDKTLGVISYETPQEATEFVFKCIWNYLNTALKSTMLNHTPRDLRLSQHGSFAATRSKIFIGREKFLKELAKSKENIAVVGESGSGKSALIATWRKVFKKTKEPNEIFITHFIGCGSGTTSIDDIWERINEELMYYMEEKGYEISQKKSNTKTTIEDHIRIFKNNLNLLNEKNDRCVIVLDGLDKVDKTKKNFKVS